MADAAVGRDVVVPSEDSQQRLHSLVYSVVYPAFLGTFLFGLLSKSTSGEGPSWGILLACYFTLQQIEGSIAGSKAYGFWRAAIDGIEIALMVVAFDALGLFPAMPPLDLAAKLGLNAAYIISGIFILPVVPRVVFNIRGTKKFFWKEPNAAFYWSLTLMSVAATILSQCYPALWAFRAIVGLLVVYLIGFQIWNEPIVDWLENACSLAWAANFRRLPKGIPAPPAEPEKSAVEEAAEEASRSAIAAKQSAKDARVSMEAAQKAAKAAAASETEMLNKLRHDGDSLLNP